MKAVRLCNLDGLKTIDVIRSVINQPRQPNPRKGTAGGLTIADIRARCRVEDEIDKLGPDADTLLLEDADHGTLVHAFNDFTWGASNKKVLAIIDAVMEAKEPENPPQ